MRYVIAWVVVAVIFHLGKRVARIEARAAVADAIAATAHRTRNIENEGERAPYLATLEEVAEEIKERLG